LATCAGQVLNLRRLVVSARWGFVAQARARGSDRVMMVEGMVASRSGGITIQPAVKWNMFDPRLISWRTTATGTGRPIGVTI